MKIMLYLLSNQISNNNRCLLSTRFFNLNSFLSFAKSFFLFNQKCRFKMPAQKKKMSFQQQREGTCLPARAPSWPQPGLLSSLCGSDDTEYHSNSTHIINEKVWVTKIPLACFKTAWCGTEYSAIKRMFLQKCILFSITQELCLRLQPTRPNILRKTFWVPPEL